MNDNAPKRAGGVWFVVAIVAFVAAVVYAVVAALMGSGLANSRDDVLPLILAVAGVISLAGWWWDRARASGADEDIQREREKFESELQERESVLREARGQVESAREAEAAQRRSREQLESRLEEREEALGRERYLRSRAEDAHQAERDWRRELHAEIMRISIERGALGGPGDVPSMVLRLARTLVSAEKGLLFSRQDEDDGLALVASEGFEHDPEGSALVLRFAREVLEHDQTVREENPEAVGAGQRAKADEEINNLVAIPIYIHDEFNGVVVCANNPDGFEDYDEDVLLSVGDQAGAVLQNARLQGELRASYLATVGVLADAIEVKDPLLRGHSDEVSSYVAAVAERLELPPKRREELIFGSLLHDIGKIGISERILLKPAALTPEERAVIELHPRIGYRLVEQVPALRSIAPAILHHHEQIDGNGYPSGLSGEEIPLEARIICVADSFSAMISERPYRDRMTPEEACAELERHAGTQFDPEVVRVFVDEVRCRPPVPQLRKAEPEDPELEVRLESEEPVLGHGTLAVVDNLTMLYTRRHMHEVAHAEAQRAAVQNRPFGVVLVELVGIDALNRTEGYAAGDEKIQAVASVVQRAAARTGGTACRHGGHRLALIFPAANERATERLAEEITAELHDGPRIRTAAAAWRPDDTGESVIDRARKELL